MATSTRLARYCLATGENVGKLPNRGVSRNITWSNPSTCNSGFKTACTQSFTLKRAGQNRTYATGIFSASTLNASSDINYDPSPATPAARVSVPIDGHVKHFSALLLRDMCQCPSCVHESSRQRLYSTADVPAEISAKEVRMAKSGESVRIKWHNDAPGFENDHTTNLEITDLKQVIKYGRTSEPFQRPPQTQLLWGSANAAVPDTDFNEYMKDDAVVYTLMRQLESHGLCFVTGIPQGKEDALVEIARRMGPMKDTFYGYTWDVRTVPSAINAAYTSQDLGFHTDLLYFQNPPHVQLLHCLQSSASGGASVFADAFKSAADLFAKDEDSFNILASVPVNYHYNHPNSNLYHTTKKVFELRPLRIGDKTYDTVREYLEAWKTRQSQGVRLPDVSLADCLEKINWGPPFLAPFSLHEQSGQPAMASTAALETLNTKAETWHAAARKFSALLHRPASLFERLMKPGECVLFNNTRVLHARRAFDSNDVGKARWLKGGYVDKDPFLSKLRVLEGKYR